MIVVTPSWKFLRKVVSTAAACCAVWGVVSFVYYWDPTRVAIKRFMASDPYRYEETHPQNLKFDPQKAITIRTADGAKIRRKALASAIWGTPEVPADYSLGPPIPIDLEAPRPTDCPDTAAGKRYGTPLRCEIDHYRGTANLAEISQQEFTISPHYRSYIGQFRPQVWNKWTVLYHHGYAGTYHDQHRSIARLIEHGYAVLAFNLPGFGGNHIPGAGLTTIQRTMSPVMLALEYAVRHEEPKGIATIGLSAGGWAMAMATALDPRVRASYPVASPIYPVALTDPKLEAPPISREPGLLDSAGYLDLFVLGTSGSGNKPRRQLQIFNRYDRCCWRNQTALLYADAVQHVASELGGEFEVRIDESHARHKISRQAMDWILADLERLRQ